MPRPKSVGKWNLKKTPDEFYMKEDPFNVKNDPEEILKADIIGGLINDEICLDVGCGEGHHTRASHGIDISPIAIGRARRLYPQKHFFVHDITSEPFRVFWSIVISEVLYYIEPDKLKDVSKNIKQMLHTDGQLIVSAGQYFTESDIREIFPFINFDKVYKFPSKKYEYNLIMCGEYV